MFLGLIAASGCGLDNIYHEESQEIVIEAYDIPEGLTEVAAAELANQELEIEQSESLGELDVDSDLVDHVKLALVRIEIVEEDDRVNLDFLSSIEIFLEAAGLDRISIASADDIADGLKSIELDVVDQDLSEYLLADGLELVTVARGTKPTQETTLLSTIGLDVDINIKSLL